MPKAIRQTRDSVTSYYHYDGLGSTRELTSSAGIVTDEYTYDAFGNLLDKSGVTVNTHLYTGEFFDSHLGFYYLRARYMNPQVGRFVTMDTFAGIIRDPYSLHKYLYAHANPVNMVDPSGQMSSYAEITVAGSIIGAMSGIYVYHVTHPPEERDALGYVTWGAGGSLIGALLAHGSWVLWLSPQAATIGISILSDVDGFIVSQYARLGRKLGTKISQGRLPFPKSKEGFKQAVETVRATLKNPTAVTDIISKSNVRGNYDLIHVYSNNTNFTVSLRVLEQGKYEFDTLIHGISSKF